MLKNLEVGMFLRLDGGAYIVKAVRPQYDPKTGVPHITVWFHKWPKDNIKGSQTHRSGKILMEDIIQAPKYKFIEILGDELAALVRAKPSLKDWADTQLALLPLYYERVPEPGTDFYFGAGRILPDRADTTIVIADYGKVEGDKQTDFAQL